jgi:ubiquinone/menaquinone biosynthesis C-methylase UbiE
VSGFNVALSAMLQCPTCRKPLRATDSSLECDARHLFPIVDGVPILLPTQEDRTAEVQHESQRRIYDRFYSRDASYRLELWQEAYVRRLDQNLGWGDQAESCFLDVGAGGDGYTVIEAARKGGVAAGCDISIVAMRNARRFAEAEGVAGRTLFVACTAESLPFRDAMFDSAAAVHVLEHLPDDQRATAEVARVLRPGGRVFIGVPNSFDRMPLVLRPIYRWHDRRIGHLRQYSPDELTAVTRAAGLETSRTFVSAHWAKVWQLAIHLAASHVHVDDSRLWWWFERRDERASPTANGLHTNLVAIKK